MEDDLNKVEAVFGPVSRADSVYGVRASAKYYPNKVKVFIPNVPYLKMIPFMEERSDEEVEREFWSLSESDADKTSNEDNVERSLRKTNSVISDLVLCNQFNAMATFTFSPKKTKDRTDVNAVKIQMSNWLKNVQKRYGKFRYLIVPEFHDDGVSLHFHALFRDFPGKLIDSGQKINGRVAYNIKSYTLGFNSLVKIDESDEDLDKVSYYVKKYIVKDMPQFQNKHRFWASKGLDRPVVIDNPADWYLRNKPLRAYENDYGLTLFFDRSEESDEEVAAS